MRIDSDFHREYEKRCALFEDLGPVAERLIHELLRANGLDPHSVRHRIKTKDSVQRKVGQEDAEYDGLEDIHDLLGIRVITFFPDEVDRVAKVIEAEFSVDQHNSVDKRALLDPDRFGYLSLHYVVALNQTRSRLTEHVRFDGWKFEVQIRSILQHAWAEIEHDLGYHTAGAIPDSFRRRFSRLAGLLEIADDEFQTLRSEVTKYQQSVNQEVSKAPESVPIDQDSIAALVEGSEAIAGLDWFIAEQLDSEVGKGMSNAGVVAARLRRYELSTIAEVSAELASREEMIKAFAVHWAKRPGRTNFDHRRFTAGLSLFYLMYVRVAEGGEVEAVRSYLEAEGIEPQKTTRQKVAEEIMESYRAASRTAGAS